MDEQQRIAWLRQVRAAQRARLKTAGKEDSEKVLSQEPEAPGKDPVPVLSLIHI